MIHTWPLQLPARCRWWPGLLCHLHKIYCRGLLKVPWEVLSFLHTDAVFLWVGSCFVYLVKMHIFRCRCSAFRWEAHVCKPLFLDIFSATGSKRQWQHLLKQPQKSCLYVFIFSNKNEGEGWCLTSIMLLRTSRSMLISFINLSQSLF